MNAKTKLNLKAVSLFSSAGIAEHFLKDIGVNVLVANELLRERATLHERLYPHTKMICGDILDETIFSEILKNTPPKIDFLLASPPCQGMSVAGKNKNETQMRSDKRNFLVFKVLEFVELKKPNFVLIENVPPFLKLKFEFEGNFLTIVDIIKLKFKEYEVKADIFDSANYGVAQTRKRAVVRMFKKGFSWGEPKKESKICVKDVIWNLPSIEAGERSNLPWHFARKHALEHIECLKQTKSGESALDNAVFYPKNKFGERIKAYNTTYRRMSWERPAPTITMRNDAISSQQNVHPGREKADGTYSDARVLTPLELMLLSSLPHDWALPQDTPETLIRKCIGECIPPLLIKKIVEKIEVKND